MKGLGTSYPLKTGRTVFLSPFRWQLRRGAEGARVGRDEEGWVGGGVGRSGGGSGAWGGSWAGGVGGAMG